MEKQILVVYYAWQSIDNIDIYKYANFYQNIPCCSRVISIFANWRRTDRQTDPHSDSSGLCNFL